MEPSTLIPPDGHVEGYGLRDDALDQLLITTGYQEVTIHYRPAIKTIQDAFCTDKRIRVIALPFDDEREIPWPHLAWIPLWSNQDTCVLVADPLEPTSHHNDSYLLPLGFAQHVAHTDGGYPYYLPRTTPEVLWPRYMKCHPVWITEARSISPGPPQNTEDSEATNFSLLLESLLRLRAFIADQLLIENGFSLGVTYHHQTLVFELPLPEFPETAESPWLLSFLLIDAARSIATLGKTDHLTKSGLISLIRHTCSHFSELDKLIGNWQPSFKFVEQFEELQKIFSTLTISSLRDPIEMRKILNTLLNQTGILID